MQEFIDTEKVTAILLCDGKWYELAEVSGLAYDEEKRMLSWNWTRGRKIICPIQNVDALEVKRD